MEWIDTFAKPWQTIVGKAYESMGGFGRKLEDFMHGKWLGHPLHAALIHVPIGAWTVALILDLFGGSPATNAGADWAVAIGAIFAIPAAITGSTDFHPYGDRTLRRIGGLHMLLNVVALLLYCVSLMPRYFEARGIAHLLSYVAFACVGVSGYLGGLMVYEKRLGVNRSPEPEDGAAPEEYVSVMPVVDLPEGRPTLARVGSIGVVLIRSGLEIYALADSCSHQGGPLHQGEFKEGCIVCPWHGSRFRVTDGIVELGPSVYSQPTFPVRIENGMILVKAVRPDTQGAEYPTPHGQISMR
jgi:nitrite reductase/ring-hydroxylating ferredoxin subunit/uncharacterized membrane protein